MDYKKYFPWIVIIILFIIIGVLFYFNVSYKSQLVNQDTNHSVSQNSKTENDLALRGINTNKVAIRYLDVSGSWEDQNISFSLKRAYLTPDIADIGSNRDNYAIGTKNAFLVVEVQVINNDTTGNRRFILTGENYLRVVDTDNNPERAPIPRVDINVAPQEEKTDFVIFVVDKNTKETNLLSGLLAQPKITHLNFYGSDAKIYNGVFLYKTGLADAYSK